MASKLNRIGKDIMSAMKKATEHGTSAYDTTAEVRRIEGDIAWVHIAGGVDETPVKLTVSAKAGDSVQVRVGGGRAWITGNATSPPTDDRKANIATEKAEIAGKTATSAAELAESAMTDAEKAQAAARIAEDSAVIAKQSARNASEYATTALGNLSTVQSVAETLTWITQHGTMAITEDTSVDMNHVYFVRDVDGDYEVGNYRYSIVAEPKDEDLSTYYELSIDESLNNYVGTHLALTGNGLYVLMDDSGYKLRLTNDGAYIEDPSGATVATYSTEAVIGNLNGYNYLRLTRNGLTLTTDGGQSAAFEVVLYDDTTTSAHTNFGHQFEVYNGAYIAGLDPRIADGTITLSLTMYNSMDGQTYTESKTFTAGTVSQQTAFVYNDPQKGEQKFIVHYDGKYSITLICQYTYDSYTLTVNGTATYNLQTNRSTYYTLGRRANGSNNGQYSVAEGYNVTASGNNSHAQNTGTVAGYGSQTAIGQYNDNKSTSALEIGNGSPQAHSNALTVDWNGNVVASGGLTLNGDESVADWVTEQGTNGSWKYRKWANGRFEAILHSSAGSTGSMTQLGSSGIYYSAVSAVTFPSAIGIASIDYCSAVCSPPSNYFMMMITNRLSTSSVYIGYLRFGSGSAVTGVDYSVKIEGTWA